MAHVLDDAQRRDIQLLIHPHGAPRVGNRNRLRSRDDDAAGDGDRLAQRERDVAGAWRHVDDQIIDILPSRAAEELLDDPVKHGAAPDHRRIIAREKRHRDQLDPVLARRNDLAAVVARQLRADAEHDRHVRSIDVAVNHGDAAAHLSERDGEIDGDRRLADASFASTNGDDVLDACNGGLRGIHVGRRTHLRGHLDVH